MDFSKRTIGNNIGEFLRDNLMEDRDKESIKRIMSRNKLAYKKGYHRVGGWLACLRACLAATSMYQLFRSHLIKAWKIANSLYKP